MAEAVICEPLRTPVGRFGGVLRDVPAHDAGRRPHPRVGAAHRSERRRHRRRRARPGIPERRGAGDRPGRRAGRGARDGRARPAGRPALRCRPAGGPDGLHAGGDRRRRSGARRRGGVDEPDRVRRHRVALGSQGRVVAAGRPARAGPGHRRRNAFPGSGWDGRDGREPAGPSSASAARTRTRSRCSSHQRAVAAQRSGVFAQEIVPVAVPQRRGDPVLVDADEHPRADTSLESLARLRPVRLGRGPGVPRSPQATPAGRTTAPRSASSPRPSGPARSVCDRWPGW